MLKNRLTRYEQFTPFTEPEAWGLFRVAAFAEAIGWTLLISGIGIKQYIIPGNDIAVQLAGRVHGTLFLIYIVAVIVLYPSQKWTKKRTIIAGFASVPPYGSLLIELWLAHKRHQSQFQQHTTLIAYSTIAGNLSA